MQVIFNVTIEVDRRIKRENAEIAESTQVNEKE